MGCLSWVDRFSVAACSSDWGGKGLYERGCLGFFGIAIDVKDWPPENCTFVSLWNKLTEKRVISGWLRSLYIKAYFVTC